MNKRYLHHLWTKLRYLSYWHFLVAAAILGLIAVLALRQNNITALRLRENVVKVDQENGDVEGALRTLRQYVYSHMNTNLSTGNGIYPPIQLKYTYERLVATEKNRVSDENAKIYNDAQNYCEAKFPKGLSGSGRIPCIQQFIDSHGVKERAIPDSLYKFDFVSPPWSPDLAGLSIVAAGVFGVLAVARFGLEYWLRHTLDT
jgi:hypothetical protein